MIKRLSIEEKARTMFDDYDKMWSEKLDRMSPEKRAEIEQDWATHPESRMSPEKFEEKYRKAHDFFDELRKGGHIHDKNGVDIIDLYVGEFEQTGRFDDVQYAPIENLSERLGLGLFLQGIIQDFYFVRMLLRGVKPERLDTVLQKGTDRDDRITYATIYAAKALEYGGLPKLILGYDGSCLEEVKESIRDYEHRFIVEPKSALVCAIRVQEAK